MRMMTIGHSPYLLTSHAKLNSEILKHIYKSNHEVAGIVWAHDENYFPPCEDEGSRQFYYDFTYDDVKHSVPIIPFEKNKNEVIVIHEILQIYRPEVVICIGDYKDFFYMKAIKQFHPDDLKWLFVSMNYSYPINENDIELIKDADGVLCTSQICLDHIKEIYPKDILDVSYVGCDPEVFTMKDRTASDRFRIMVSGKTLQADNIPTVMRAVSELHEELPDLELYVHANVDDSGEYDFQLLKNRFDPNGEFIVFPDKFVSLVDGLSEAEYADQLNRADMFISIPLASATSITVFEAIACGCFPLMSDCGSNADIAGMLEDHFEGSFRKSDFLVSCVDLMTTGENYLRVCDVDSLKEKIRTKHKILKNGQGDRVKMAEFIRKRQLIDFLNSVVKNVEEVSRSSNIVCLEV